ncbi:protocadherin Fat 4-like [Watersipora subatra]|uniref:protocadherin Fat 4-like n=1 Tax=Watersipora subatra TaxID=2589382 RepID=UPI00355C947D
MPWELSLLSNFTHTIRRVFLFKSTFVNFILFLSVFQSLLPQVHCQGTKKYFTVEENLPIGSVVGLVDSNPGYTYELATETDYFTIDQNSGEISIKQVIDREQLSNSDIKFVVKQKVANAQVPSNTLIEVIITVTDINDNLPKFSSRSLEFTIAENDVPLQPFTITATDSDAGNNGSSSLVYTILSGNENGYWSLTTSSSAGPKFASLGLLQAVDREDIGSFRLVIEVRDGGNPPKRAEITVQINVQDLNDNHPMFDYTLYTANVLENATAGTEILETRASDSDSGFNSALVFSMTRNSLFSMDRMTGAISLEVDSLNEAYSNEETLCQASYCNTSLCIAVCVLEIQVADQEGEGSSMLQDQSRVKITIIDVNDHAPVIAGNKDATVSESATINTYVFRLTVTDADKGPNGEWSLEYLSGNELGHFKEPVCLLSYCLIYTKALVDKEQVSQYNLTFVARDEGAVRLSSTASVIVTVLDANDHHPQFSSPSYSAVVSELDPVNSFVAAVTATDEDQDENGRVTYQISDGNNQQFFKIDGDSGLVTINRRVDSDGLDNSKIVLNISASDHGSNVLKNETTLEIDIIDENDEIPEFSKPEYHVEVQENNEVDLVLLTIVATDRDKGANGSVKYRLGDEMTREYPGLFSIGAINGELKLSTSLDRETQDGYAITVVAYDLGSIISQSSQVTVYVNVTDSNDNSPVFYPSDYYAVIPESAESGYLIVTLEAVDADLGEGGAVRYSIPPEQSASGLFAVSSDGGVVSLTRSLPRSPRFYTIQVEARDGGGKLARATVNLKVANPEERSPEFTQQTYSFTVAEDAEGSSPSIGQEVGRVNAIGTTVINYFIIDGDPERVFTINQNTGTLTTTKRLDRDTVPAYHLTVVAEGLSKMATASVNITVSDENDNSPVFREAIYYVETPEDTPLNSVVFVAEADDIDAGNNATLTYTISASAADRLTIDGNTGAVRLSKMIRLGETLTATVTATDGGYDPRSDNAQLVITASDVNDHSPVFAEREYYIAVNESDIINSRFLQLIAVDDDLGANADITYSLIGGVNKTRPEFGVFPDGWLYIAQKLDREVKDRYQLLVSAQDGGSPLSRSDSVIVHVKVLDDNDNSPQFSTSLYQFTVQEGKDSGTYIGSVSARDADIGRNSDLMYFFASYQPNFDLDPFTGEMRSRTTFDREARSNYQLAIIAIDNGITRLRAETTVSIIIGDVNDNSPTFSKSVYDVVIAEDVQVGHMINPITATDPDLDVNGMLEYSIIAGNGDDNFKIDENSGVIKVDSALDRDIQSEYKLLVKASDNGLPPLDSEATVHIKLSDANNRSPSFDPSSYSVNIKESAEIGTIVGAVTATDDDIGANAVIIFSITEGNEDGTFDILRETGEIKLVRPLDYEHRQLYTLTIRASNRPPSVLYHQTRFSINIEDENDNKPKFTEDLLTATISENSSISTLVLKVTANDSDSGLNGKVSYAIVSQPMPPKFVINADGEIKTDALLDRESEDSYDVVDAYTLVIKATDQAEPPSSRLSVKKSVLISIADVNDNSPKFLSLPNGVVQENSADGTEVMTVRARDKDAGRNAQIEYSLKSGTSYFSIDPSTGLIITRRSVSTTPVIHHITVMAADKGEPQRSSEQSIKIILSSVASSGLSFTNDVSSNSLLETLPVGSDVIRLSSDANNAEYYVTAVTSEGVSQPGFFKMSNAQMKTAMPLDRDSGYEKYTVEVYVREKSSVSPNTARTEVEITLIDVNDSPPTFSSYSYEASCMEDAAVGFTVKTVTANDPDKSSNLNYTVSGTGGLFTINNNGEIKVAGTLDRETTPEHLLTVHVSDGTHTTSIQVTITIIDVNDEAPVFIAPSQPLSISELASPGDPVGYVLAIDADLGVGGEVAYELVTQWGSDLFSVDEQSGLVRLEGSLNYEMVELYIFEIQATDRDTSNPLATNFTLYINVIDENNNEPVFIPSTYNPVITESAATGSAVVTVSAIDYDAGMNGRVHYSILNTNLPFTIDSSNGTVYTSRQLDRETADLYNVIIQAEDLALINPRSSTVRVTVSIEDKNDNDPVFTPPYVVQVNEAAEVDAVVATIVATDADIGANGAVTYSLLSHTDIFSLGFTNGNLKILSSLNREATANYSLRVKAEDGGMSPRSTETIFSLIVEDDNDNSPQFDVNQLTTVEVVENQTAGVTLLTLSATDADTGLASELRYYIIAGDPNEDFHLDQLTGSLSVSRSLDFERVQEYSLTVQVEDLGQNARYSTLNIQVKVLDSNDCPPVFYHSPYYVYLQEESTHLPVELITVKAVDADSYIYNQSTYELNFDLDDELELARNTFSIDRDSGVLTAIRSVDREAKSSFTLTVIARNTAAGSAELSGEATVHVIVKDINDHAPTFDLPIYSTSETEGPEVGRRILQVTSSDEDIGSNAEVRYALVNNSVADSFNIDSLTGWISNRVPLDREVSDLFELIVVAYDLGGVSQSSEASVKIYVTDVNDNSPAFIQEQFSVRIHDATATGSFILGATAVDRDDGSYGAVSYSLIGPAASSFNIDTGTGVIRASTRLQGPNAISFTVRATDGGHRRADASINVTFVSFDTSQIPQFRDSPSQLELREDQSLETELTKVIAVPGSGDIQYSIVGGNVADTFSVKTDGKVTLLRKLDYAVASRYDLWIEARDSVSGLSAYKNIEVNVTDINDHIPEFERALYITRALEEQSIVTAQELVKVQANDPDTGVNGDITYSLVEGNIGNPFVLSADGTLKLTKKLDRESIPSYNVVIRATDGGGLNSTTIVIVYVDDINDMFPKFESIYRWEISEDTPVGTVVSAVHAIDNDVGPNAEISYSMHVPNTHFDVTSTGNVTVKAPLNREDQAMYEVVIIAKNVGSDALTGTTTVRVTISDVNDNAPQFIPSAQYSVTFAELQQAGTIVTVINATDADAVGPNSLIRYQLVNPSSFFLIDADTAAIRSKGVLQYDVTGTHNIYTLFVEARDSGVPSHSAIASVNVTVLDANDHAPVFAKAEYFTAVPDSITIGQEILTVRASDALDYGDNALVEYSVSEGNGSSLFGVTRSNGSVYAKSPLADVTGEYRSVLVKAIDLGSPPLHSTVTVTMLITADNQSPPTWVSATALTVSVSESEESGYEIATVQATDADNGVNGLVAYSINPSSELFHIDPVTGVIVLSQPLDYERTIQHKVNIQARDSAFNPRIITKVLTVNVVDADDNPPLFSQKMYTGFVAENEPRDTPVITVSATDADQLPYSRIRYSITGPTESQRYFAIDPSSGQITTTTPFDYETRVQYSLNVKADNPLSSVHQTTVQVRVEVKGVNEFAPRFISNEYSFDVSENAEIGSRAGQLHADDLDHGVYGELEFLLIGDSNDKGFSLNKETGELLVSGTLDRERVEFIYLRALVKNPGPITGNDTDTVAIWINLGDANDSPKFEHEMYNTSIEENAGPRDVLTVKATDTDQQVSNRQFSYALENDFGLFHIQPGNGKLTTTGSLDRESKEVYRVIVQAIDQGTPPRTGQAVVNVRVLDVNDNAPYFEPTIPEGEVLEGSEVNTPVLSLAQYTFDEDIAPNQGPFTYELSSQYFYIDSISGIVYTMNGNTDYEAKKEFALNVKVKDRGDMLAELQAKVLIKDINDESSTSRDLTIVVQSYELMVNGLIGTVEPSDVDLVGDYSCSLPDQPHFKLQGSTCNLLAVNLTRDTQMQVSGSDGVHDQVDSSVHVKVRTYSNSTLEKATVTRISGITSKQFVESSMTFLSAIDQHLATGERSRLLAIQNAGPSVDVYMVLQRADYSYASLGSVLSLNKGDIERASGVTIANVKRSVCSSQSCSNRGQCNSLVVVSRQLEYMSTDSLTLAYHQASLMPKCTCEPEYAGEKCMEDAGACRSAPCMNGGYCVPSGVSDFQCVCTPQWSGNLCQHDIDECSRNVEMCQNGGSCFNEQGSHRCECTKAFTGPRCEEPIKCDRNPCENGASCTDSSGSYTCHCSYGFYGDRCELSSYGFEESSYMEFLPMNPESNDITMTLSTKTKDALLLFQQGVGSEYMALELIDGSVVFTFYLTGSQRNGVAVSKTVSTGDWYRIHATRSSTEASLEVVRCDSLTACTSLCEQRADCYSSISLPQVSGNRIETDGKHVSLGGVSSINLLLPYAGFIKSGSFVGCIADLQLDGNSVSFDQAVQKQDVKDSCPRLMTLECNDVCGQGIDCDAWFSTVCACDGYGSPSSCDDTLINADVSIGAKAALIYKYRESYTSSHLLASGPSRRKRATLSEKSIELGVRTGNDADIMQTVPADPSRALTITNGFVTYGSLTNELVKVTDGSWHDVSLVVGDSVTVLSVDSQPVSDNSTTPVDFSDILTVSEIVIAGDYEGCIRGVRINKDQLPMSSAVTEKFDITVRQSDAVSAGCDSCQKNINFCGIQQTCEDTAGKASCVISTSDQGMKPWLLAIIIVVAVVATLSIIFAAVCLINCCRKRNSKEKGSGTIKPTEPIMTSQLSESCSHNGHDNFADSEILYSEQPKMTRTFNNMSPAIPALQASRTVPSPYQPLEDSTVIIEGSVTGGLGSVKGGINSNKLNSEQFYDFDEASSIATSDVDIRKYYKGYRKGDNMEMQMIPQHMRQQGSRSLNRISPTLPVTQSQQQRQYTASPVHRHSPHLINGGYDPNRQETPISQLQHHRHATPIDELNRRIAIDQRADVTRRDSESSLTDSSVARQPHWTHTRTAPTPTSRPNSRSASRQNNRPGSRQHTPHMAGHISTQRQQDLNKLSHRSGSSSIDESDDDLARRQPMERNIYSEGGDSSSDESSNDSFTASEFEADEPKVRNDYQPTNMMFTKLQEVEDESDTGDPNAYRTTFSWDGLRNVDNSLQRFINHSDSNTDLDSMTKTKKLQPTLRWDHFLSWGPSFEKLVGVFADIAELPQEYHTQPTHDSSDYV